jgi:peptidyl-prolyl cis-trans isomerase B (cyclophilin B)
MRRSPLARPLRLLEAHLHDPRSSVRALSIFGLGVIGLGSDPNQLVTALRHDPSGAVRVAAADSLARYEAAGRLVRATEAAAAAGLVACLQFDPAAAARGACAIALDPFSRGPQAESVSRALSAAMRKESDRGVRERIMWTIFRRYAKRVSEKLLRAGLSDPDSTVRIEAVRAFGMRKDRVALAWLRPLLNDLSWRVQEQTAAAILAIEGKPPTLDWKRIPAYIHVPARKADPLARLPAFPRPRYVPAGPPRPSDALLGPGLEVQSARDMVSPMHGPHPRVRIVTTQGNIYVVLYPEWAPLTVTNFLNLVNRGFYDRNRWFRIVPDFVVQTGEQNAKTAPGPGYTIGAEENPLEQNAYVISMGLNYDKNGPQRDSAGSEYYITLSPQYHLDDAFTVFGRVTSGFSVLGRLVESDRVIRIEQVPDATL